VKQRTFFTHTPSTFIPKKLRMGREEIEMKRTTTTVNTPAATAILEPTEEDHWTVMKNLPAGVVVHAPDTRIVRCNSEASQLLGRSSDQMQGKAALDPDWHFVRENGDSPQPW
jgi:PAS domain-containing protein